MRKKDFHQGEDWHLSEFNVENVKQPEEKHRFAVIRKYWGQCGQHINEEGRPDVRHEHIMTIDNLLTLLNSDTPETDINHPCKVESMQAVIEFHKEIRPNNNQRRAENIKYENTTNNKVP